MIIRPATQNDGAAIAAFWSPQILDTVVTFNSVPKSADDVAEMIAARPCFLVAEVAGEVIGFVTYDQFRGGVGYRHTMEHTIILAPDAKGQGAGRALMLAAMEHARARQVHSLWAGVSGENAAGVAFHAALGFEQVAVLPQVGRKFERWMDLVLMQKRL
ncbi:GNAT family N-acetyltransferase [Octadecabacter sp. 1_MG-2023]|uniref:GNAT family N-acetyltransferase n=1 Tax=unclassified Octadecabacter TaxID=196158 RepID=UPI001C07FA7A|nr:MULTISPECIES: GNAT family N-acetyltransferase [unclassified Octadecabacter]MBU2993903.1 GNAT family N-acetyltransferase [Octadecabacter sp. B2R22]MDO6735251.1 GNAT family N-acetyltransferase [Octadecabacter sp. 1_MG-2023]